jgi:hypothetical protein
LNFLLKPKEKNCSFLHKLPGTKKAFAVLLSLVLLVVFYIPSSSSAQNKDVEVKNIKVKVDTYIDNKPENFYRLGKDGNFRIDATMRLLEPSSLHFDSDNARTGGLDGEFISAGFALVPKDTSQACRTVSWGGLNYLSCNTADPELFRGRTKQSDIVEVGDYKGETLDIGNNKALLIRVGSAPEGFRINSTVLGKLGITNSSAQGVLGEFYLYPIIAISSGNGIRGSGQVFFAEAGKSIHVEYYDTQAQATSAASKPRPVPAYSGTIGSATASETGSPLLGFINTIIGAIIGFLNQLVYTVFYVAVAPLLESMLSMRTYTDTFAAVIYPGWEIIRNLCNILFIEGDPIVQVRPYGAVPKNAYWVDGVAASSFDLHIAEVLRADIRFAWTVRPGDQVPGPAFSEGDSSATEDVVEPVTSTASVSSSEPAS